MKELNGSGGTVKLIVNTVPTRFKDVTISSALVLDWQPDVHSATVEFIKNFVRGSDESILYSGASGIGKSYAAAAIVNKALQLKPSNDDGDETSILWAPVGDIFESLAEWRDYKSEQFWKADHLLRNADLVVLDDIGYVGEYERLQRSFWRYVDYRYSWNKPVVFTCQFDLPDWDALYQQNLPAGMVRRIQDMCNNNLVNAL
jgi:DNA replication protein DnaC